MNLFYDPGISGPLHTLSKEESKHIVRVLRKSTGDAIDFTDGKGFFYRCKIVDASPASCQIEVIGKNLGNDQRDYQVTLAVAPTKNIGRFEWFLEKATEIGIDRIVPFYSMHSERTTIKPDRLKKVIVAAMKQSLKSNLPELSDECNFNKLITEPFVGKKYIAYINDEVITLLSKTYPKGEDVMILIGPEGDFSPKEVKMAIENGFEAVSLGTSRLRTETAGIVACHTINLINM